MGEKAQRQTHGSGWGHSGLKNLKFCLTGVMERRRHFVFGDDDLTLSSASWSQALTQPLVPYSTQSWLMFFAFPVL